MSSPDVLRRKAALTLLRRQVDAGLSGRPLPIHHPAGTGDINFRRLNHWFSTRRAVPYVIGALGPAATASASEAVADPLMVVPFAMISLVWCAVWWLMAGDAASYNKEFARRAEAMFLDDPSIEAALLDGATVPHELLFRYGLAYPHPPVDATTLSNQLRSLGPKGRDLAIAADATGWADPAATGPAIDYLLHNPATRRFWEDLFSAPGWEPGGGSGMVGWSGWRLLA